MLGAILFIICFILISGYFHEKRFDKYENCICHDPQYCQCETTDKILKRGKYSEESND
jgi:hypothetical protein